MAKGIIGGNTDYSHQSFNDILEDLVKGEQVAKEFIQVIESGIEKLEQSGYWKKQPFNFKSIIGYSLKYFKTTQEELYNIHIEIQRTVQDNHCKRLERIGTIADEINKDIGKYWHREYDEYKDYDNPEFFTVENIYNDTRDMAVYLLDYSNIAFRLKDFIGKTSLENNNNSTSNETIFNSGNLIINKNFKNKNQNLETGIEKEDSRWTKANVIIAIVVGLVTIVGIIWQIYSSMK